MKRHALRLVLAVAAPMALQSAGAVAQDLDMRFSCSTMQEQGGERITLADSGEIKLDGGRIVAFRWESALFRSSNGFDCSIDESDGLELSTLQPGSAWRVTLTDAQAARLRRGYDFDRGAQCNVDFSRDGARLAIAADCPALCGSRSNFSALSVDIDSSNCRYRQ